MPHPIALLTDFGTVDHYVGVMKGVMQRISPQSPLIDITHAVPPQSIEVAAGYLRDARPYFADNTIFLVVVDPGVGSTRDPIAVQTTTHRFIAPDNGVLSFAIHDDEIERIVALENRALQLADPSHTFHGRDIFAPAAAYLASGETDLSTMGRDLEQIQRIPQASYRHEGQQIRGRIERVDHFGNCITNIGPLRWDRATTLHLGMGDEISTFQANHLQVEIRNHLFKTIHHAYHEVAQGEPLVQIESSGFLEIAVNHGHAAQQLGLQRGDSVLLIITNQDLTN